MQVRAKFRVTTVAKTCGNYNDAPVDTAQVELSAVCGEQNKSWSKWTPCGTIKMQINNPAALEQFVPGAFVYVDFSDAPATDA
jgi:hypothetical protein